MTRTPASLNFFTTVMISPSAQPLAPASYLISQLSSAA